AEAALFDGWRAPELLTVRDEVDLFCTEMRMHLKLEEATLFPAILAKIEGRPVDDVHELKEPLDLFEDEHDAAAGLLKRIHRLTEGYRPPPGAPDLQRRLYAACEGLAESLRGHIYLEGQVLFKRLSEN
ncbi:MAG: hemerythrin domain-containing protein, partial [Firmicutes bacterium]|nr:hemerythrin domain-containing protein [Bacillota bacterium]